MAKSTQKYLPLAEAGTFARENGIGKEFDAIRGIPLHGVPDKMAVEKGHIVALFREHGLLDEFIDEYWPYAKGLGGPQLLEKYERFRRRQIAAANAAVGGVALNPEEADKLDADERAQDAFGHKAPMQTQGTSFTPTSQMTLLDDVEEINRRKIKATEKKLLIDARVGQGGFRKDVLKEWENRCAVTGSTTLEAIRASHIQPWRDSNDNERLDKYNGLPLIASLDALFDVGLISFDPLGRVIAAKLNDTERRLFGLSEMKLRKRPNAKTSAYLARHRHKHGFGN